MSNETHDVFELDSDEHTRGEGCVCGPDPCTECGRGWVHFQGVYGGMLRVCDSCGCPDYSEPPPDISPERAEYLRKRWTR
jgi:hypothetical protein